MTNKENIFNRTVLIYGAISASLIIIVKIFEFQYFIKNITVEIYVGIIAIIFTFIGVWIGLKFISKKDQSRNNFSFSLNKSNMKKLKISQREYDVLTLMAKGLSNQEIADRLFISLATVKTHSSNLFEKLNVQRRTQAIFKAKELEIIP